MEIGSVRRRVDVTNTADILGWVGTVGICKLLVIIVKEVEEITGHPWLVFRFDTHDIRKELSVQKWWANADSLRICPMHLH
jgi:hypothetical protein